MTTTREQAPANETAAERRKRLREEYRAALDEFTSFHPDNVTREYAAARERLDKAERALSWWRR